MKHSPDAHRLARKLIAHCQKELSFAADSHSGQAWVGLIHQAEHNLADVEGGLPGADVRVNAMAVDLRVML